MTDTVGVPNSGEVEVLYGSYSAITHADAKFEQGWPLGPRGNDSSQRSKAVVEAGPAGLSPGPDKPKPLYEISIREPHSSAGNTWCERHDGASP
jgi:hypothetical protein